MATTVYFLRHGKTKVDSETPVSQWVLDELGVQQAKEIENESAFQNVEVIIASAEPKAFQTVEGLAKKLGREVYRESQLSELDRDKGGHMDYATYEETVEKMLKDRDTSFCNWETANHALERFSKKVDELSKQFEGKTIMIVGHGYTMNLYFAKLAGELDRVHERLESNDFCDWGIVQDGKIVKDLAYGFERPGEKLV